MNPTDTSEPAFHRVTIVVLVGLAVLFLVAGAYFAAARYYASALDLRIKPGMSEAQVLHMLNDESSGRAVITQTMWEAPPGAPPGPLGKVMFYQYGRARPLQVTYTSDLKVLSVTVRP